MRRAVAVIERISRAFGALAAVLVGVLMALMAYEVALRYVFKAPTALSPAERGPAGIAIRRKSSSRAGVVQDPTALHWKLHTAANQYPLTDGNCLRPASTATGRRFSGGGNGHVVNVEYAHGGL